MQTPETVGTTHYFFCQAHHFMLDRPDITEAIYQDVVKAFGEDRDMIEAQQRVLDTDPHFHPAATVHDSGLAQARAILRQRLQQEQAAHTTGT